MANRKGRRGPRSSRKRRGDTEMRTFFGDKDPVEDFEAELGDGPFSPESYAEGDDDKNQFVKDDTEAIFGGTEKILAEADVFSRRIERRRSLATRRDTSDMNYQSEADMSRGPGKARRRPRSRNAEIARKSQGTKRSTMRDFYELSDSDTKTKPARRKPVKGTVEASEEDILTRERGKELSSDSALSLGGVSSAAADDTSQPPVLASPEPADLRITATRKEQDAFSRALDDKPRRSTRESRRRKSPERNDGGSPVTAEGLTVTDLAMVLLDVLTAEQQQQQRKLQQQQKQEASPTRQQPPCEACASQENPADRGGTSARGKEVTTSRCAKCGSSDEERVNNVGKLSRNCSPLRRPKQASRYYEMEENDYDDAESRRKPKSYFLQTKHGRRGRGNHRSDRPTSIEETASTQVVETTQEAPHSPSDKRYGNVPEWIEPYYRDGCGLFPHDHCGQEGFCSYCNDGYPYYCGDAWDPGPPQAGPWTSVYGATFPLDWPQLRYYVEPPCLCVTEAPRGTILRREEVFTEDGKHRHRVQEILEGAPASPREADVGRERFQEAPSGFMRDIAPKTAASHGPRESEHRTPGGRVLLDAYEEIRPPGCPRSEPLFPQPAVAASSVLRTQRPQAAKATSDLGVPAGQLLYWEPDEYPTVRMYAPFEPAIAMERKVRGKDDLLEIAPRARKASTAEPGTFWRSQPDAPTWRELQYKAIDGQPQDTSTTTQYEGQTPTACDKENHNTTTNVFVKDEQRPHAEEERSGTYFREMSWSTSRRAAKYETFSWSFKEAADRRQRKASAIGDRMLKDGKKSSLHEKKAGSHRRPSKAASKTSILTRSSGGSNARLSKAARKDSRVPRRKPSAASSVASVAAKPTAAVASRSTAALETTAESSRFSPLSGRRLPGKAKAETKLLHEKHPTKLLSTLGLKVRRSSEVASQMLHSDITTASASDDILSKTGSRRPSIAAHKKSSKASDRGEASSLSPALRNVARRTSAAGMTEESQAHSQHHGILKPKHQTDGPDERGQFIPEEGGAKSPDAEEAFKAVSDDTSKPRPGTNEAATGEKESSEAHLTKAASEGAQVLARDGASKPESRRGSVLTRISAFSIASARKESIAHDTTGFTQTEKTMHETIDSKEPGDAEKRACGKPEDNIGDALGEDVFSSAEGTPTGAELSPREFVSGTGPTGMSPVAMAEDTKAPKHENGSSEKSRKSSASIRSEKAEPTEKDGSSEEPSFSPEKHPAGERLHEVEPEIQQLPPAADTGPEADTDSKQDMDEILRELENQTTVIYPESNLVVVLAIVCIVWICVIVLLAYPGHASGWPTGSPTAKTPFMSTTRRPGPVPPHTRVYRCSTDSCIKEGEYLASLLNHDFSPCDNFYRYVCSHWERLMHNPSAGIGVATSTDTMLQDIMHIKVLEYIINSRHNDVIEAKRLYQACVNSHGDESTTELRQLFATWPPAQRWPVESNVPVTIFDVWSAAARLMRDFGVGALLGLQPALDKSYGQPVLELQLPQTLFFRGDDQRSAIVSMFRAAISESAQLLKSSGMLYELMSDVMAVFKSIAKRRPLFPGLEVKLVPFENLDHGLRTFVTVVFEGTLTRNTTVQYSNPVYFDHELAALFNELGPKSLLNFLGFRLIVSLAPFLPESMNLLKLYSVQATGRVISPIPKWVLCLRAVEYALPVCVVKAHAKLTIASGADLTSRVWMSQLESMFFRSTQRYSWMDSWTRHVVHFMLRRIRLARFYPAWSLKEDQCAGGYLPPGNSGLHLFHEASKAYQSQRLAQLTRRTRPRDVGDSFGTLARFSPGHQAVYVPFGIVNDSVPGTSTAFAFQLARMATRLYAGLAPALLDDGAADESTLLRFTDRAQRLLDELLDCLVRDYRALSASMRDSTVVDPDEARYALLAQTVAVALAHAAFKEMLHVQRIWNVDFRLASLPNLTSEQLFFVHFARDNCESSDDAYKAHRFATHQRLPPEQRVNFPLRHLPQFGVAFHCQRDAPMRLPDGAVCHVFDSVQSD